MHAFSTSLLPCNVTFFVIEMFCNLPLNALIETSALVPDNLLQLHQMTTVNTCAAKGLRNAFCGEETWDGPSPC